MTLLRLTLLCAIVVCAHTVHAQPSSSSWWSRSIWTNPERSQLWYPPPSPPQAELDEQPRTTMSPSTVPEVVQMQNIQAKLDELRTVAIINPTTDNVKAYVKFQEEQAQRASVFADTWRRALWESPELLYQGRPTNAAGLQRYDVAYDATVNTSINALAQTHGVYFFFRSDCPYCHAMVPTINALAQRFGIRVLPISLDGKGIPGLERAVADGGQAARLGVTSVPAFYLADLRTKSVSALGTGVVSLSDLEDRIYTQAFTKAGAKF